MARLKGRTLAEKLASNHRLTDSGCWRWLGSHAGRGYAQVWHDGRLQLAHRLACELAHGPIPDGFDVDHLCRVRDCVNPEHLQAVTRHENVIRQFSVKETCRRGHPWVPENILVEPRPNSVSGQQRRCRICTRAGDAARKRAKRARHRVHPDDVSDRIIGEAE